MRWTNLPEDIWYALVIAGVFVVGSYAAHLSAFLTAKGPEATQRRRTTIVSVATLATPIAFGGMTIIYGWHDFWAAIHFVVFNQQFGLVKAVIGGLLLALAALEVPFGIYSLAYYHKHPIKPFYLHLYGRY